MVAQVASVADRVALERAATEILVLKRMVGNAEALVTRLVQCHVSNDQTGLAAMLERLQARVERIHLARCVDQAAYQFEAAPVAAPLQ